MRIVRIEIENFRPIRRVARDLGEMTVLDGPDNAGRTAFLEPLRLALRNSSGQLGSSSTEHDVHFTISASAALTKTKAEEIRAELHSTGKKTEDNWGAAGKGGLSATWNATGFRQTDGRSPPELHRPRLLRLRPFDGREEWALHRERQCQRHGSLTDSGPAYRDASNARTRRRASSKRRS